MRTQPLLTLLTTLFLAVSCASTRDIVSVVDPVTHGPGTPSTPAATWTPPANAVPPPVPHPNDIILPPAGAPLDLSQIVDVALSNNPLTRATWLEARISEANLGSVRAAYLPTVDFGASLAR